MRDCISNINDDKTKLNSYIGHTTTTFSRALTCHLSKFQAIRALINKYIREDNKTPTNIRKIVVDHTEISYNINYPKKIKVLEAETK